MSCSSPVAVIGAGNVGCALAADLALRGVEVRLFNRSPGRLAAIRDAGGITVTGQIEGFAALSLVTGSLEQAVDGAGVVAVTVPTASLPAYAAALARATTGEQLIWLNPGDSGGALYLAAELARADRGERAICQLTTASHISRLTGPATVRVFLRSRASVAALPASHLQTAIGGWTRCCRASSAGPTACSKPTWRTSTRSCTHPGWCATRAGSRPPQASSASTPTAAGPRSPG